MRIITEPTVTVVSYSKPTQEVLDNVPDDFDKQAQLGAFAAKVCYDSLGPHGRPVHQNQAQIIASGHGSVLEHINIGLYVTGISRNCSLEFNRHRHLAISQRSTRYVDESEAALVLPPHLAKVYNDYYHQENLGNYESYGQMALVDIMCHNFQEALAFYACAYEELVEENPYKMEPKDLKKWARGIARAYLPGTVETKAVYTANVRAWRHIIETRSSPYADDEIRRLAYQIFCALFTVAPTHFCDYYIGEEVRGIQVITTPNKKV